MNTKTKVRKIGNSYGIILTKEVLQQLRVKEGDELYLAEAPDSSIRVTTVGPSFEQKMKIARDGMDRYKNALRELAK
jgi:putative addiction module antidote